jgi:hypothetical protein
MSITHNIEFHLGNELARLEKADSYDLFILKSCIEKEMIERRHYGKIKNSLHLNSLYVYFDKINHQEDIIKPTYFDSEYIEGVRQSDNTTVKIEYSSIDPSRVSTQNESEKINTYSWDETPYRKRIAALRNVHYSVRGGLRTRILAYVAKLNRGTIILRLLTGEVLTVKRDSSILFFEPSDAENRIFDDVEAQERFQQREFDLAKEKLNQFVNDRSTSLDKYSRDKFFEHLALDGFHEHIINKLIDSFLNSPETISHSYLSFDEIWQSANSRNKLLGFSVQ